MICRHQTDAFFLGGMFSGTSENEPGHIVDAPEAEVNRNNYLLRNPDNYLATLDFGPTFWAMLLNPTPAEKVSGASCRCYVIKCRSPDNGKWFARRERKNPAFSWEDRSEPVAAGHLRVVRGASKHQRWGYIRDGDSSTCTRLR